MLKIAIIGCGKIADAHCTEIQKVAGCKLVAACDREELMARQLCERFAIPSYFNDTEKMLEQAAPDVVHITTPPQSHFALATLCLQHDCNVYVEKPFTIHAQEAKDILDLADSRSRKVTAGHDLQFSPAARRVRKLIAEGYIGGAPLHMESYYCYDLSDPRYAMALLANKDHWVRSLPGKLLQNIISHGIARIAEYLPADDLHISAQGFPSRVLRDLGEHTIIDELRVIISDHDRTTAYFTFSSQIQPSLNQFRVFGPKNGIYSDEDEQVVIKLHGARLKSYAGRFIPPVTIAGQYIGNMKKNIGLFLRNDFHMKCGMFYLIDSFYKAIRGEGTLPISYREILTTARIMDGIFAQVQQTENTNMQKSR